MEKLQIVKDWLESVTDGELFTLWNEYARENNPDDEIFENDEYFFDEVYGRDVMGAVRAISFGDYTYSNEYLQFNGYGNIESFDGYEIKDKIDMDYLAQDILDNPNNYCDLDDLDEMLEEEESEEE